MTYDYWLIDETFLMEPSEGGKQIAEIKQGDEIAIDSYGQEINLREKKILRVSQSDFDTEMEEFFLEHGHYPDQ